MHIHSVRASLCLLFIACVMPTLTACSSVATVVRPEHIVSKNLREEESTCTSLPRIYSGVAYCTCKMMGSPAPIHTWQSTENQAYRSGYWIWQLHPWWIHCCFPTPLRYSPRKVIFALSRLFVSSDVERLPIHKKRASNEARMRS